MLAMASKRVRGPKWDDTETMLLADLKREACLRGEEGSHVWHEISRSIPGRSAIQCRRRWETLVKVYNHVQDYCTQTGQDHEELDDAELASMRLETAYRRDWYIIVEEVCSERKRRRVCDRGAAAMLSKGSRTAMEILPATPPVTTDSFVSFNCLLTYRQMKWTVRYLVYPACKLKVLIYVSPLWRVVNPLLS